MSHPRLVSPALAGLFILASLSPVLSGLPAASAAITDVMRVTGNSAGFGSPGTSTWDAYTVPDVQSPIAPGLFGWGNQITSTNDGGEPSGGVCWKTSTANSSGTDVFFYKTLFGVARGTWNDATNPPAASWSDVSRKVLPEGHYAFSDPILHTDEKTCRTWAGQMELPSPCTTDMGFRDEAAPTIPNDPVDGWTQIPALCDLTMSDHETIGSGPYSKDLPQPNALYPSIVYYCAWYVGTVVGPGLGPDSCSESLDGGRTFPATEYSLGCSSIFGHVKVSPEGYAAVPYRQCISNAGLSLSKNNGLTWSGIDIPGLPPVGHFDPSLAWSRAPNPAGHSQLYFGAALTDGLYAATSGDYGTTWSTASRISDAYTGPNNEKITRAEFPNVEAGDWDRAAISFLGTTDTTANSNGWTCNNNNQVAWYMYVAKTFDGGAHWRVERASGDPVQLGGIWPSGGGASCRNLLDFNDLDMGSDGRLYVSFADGCIAALDCTEGAAVSTSSANRGTVIRETTGCGLLAAHDAQGADCVHGTGTTGTGPKLTITSPSDGATVSAGTLSVSGTVNRNAALGGAGGSGPSAAPAPLPGLGGQGPRAGLVHPTGGQDLYMSSAPVPVGNVQRVAGSGAALVPTAPTGQVPAASGNLLTTGATEAAAEASWTYTGPVDLNDATVTVTWYGRLATSAAQEQWQVDLYIGAGEIGNSNSAHPSAIVTVDAGQGAHTATLTHVKGSGDNLVLMLRSTSLTTPALVLYGSTGFPSGLHVVENGGTASNQPPVAAFGCTVTYLTLACDASNSTDDNAVTGYNWDFGGGASATGVTASHTYTTAGSHTVILTVHDGSGLTNTVSHSYTTTNPPPPSESVKLLMDGRQQDSTNVDSTTPGDHAWSGAVNLTGATGSHTITANWYDADGTLLGNATVTVTIASGTPASITITSPADGATVSAGATDVSGAVNRGSAGPAYNGHLPLTTLGPHAGLVDPAHQDLYFHSGAPVGNVQRAQGGGPDMVPDAPTGSTPSVSGHILTTPSGTEGPSEASFTYSGPVDLHDATVTVTWYGVLGTRASSEQWKADLYVGSQTGSPTSAGHPSMTGSFTPLKPDDAKSLTFTGVTLSGTNLVVMLQSATGINEPAAVLFGDAKHPSGITVTEASAVDNPPSAAFTCTATNLALACDGSASSDDHGITSYAWTFGDGATGSGATASHTYAAAGTYTVGLTVTDTNAATNSTSHSYTVSAANVAPTAAFSCTPSALRVDCDGTPSSDSDGTISSYAWTFGDGATGSGATASHTYAAAGTYTVTLTVTDDKGATGTTSHDYTVATGNAPPTAAFTCTATNLDLACDGSASSDDHGIASYAWTFGDGATGSGATARHTYGAAGTYTVTLTVTDASASSDTATHNYTVSAANVAPTAAFACTPSGLSVACDGTASSDPDGSIASYAWDFGDGATGSGSTANHAYAAAGTYTVTLTVTDNQGATGSASHGYTVAAAAKEHVDVLLDGTLKATTTVDSSTPGDHAWSTSLDLSGLTGSHTITANWVDADGTPLGTASSTVTVQGTTSTSTTATSTTTSPATTGTDTGSAGGNVSNVAPVVDSLSANPGVATLGQDDSVFLNGTAHDDNGHDDVANVTVKVTSPSGATEFPHVGLFPTDVTGLDFATRHNVTTGDETGTYQVDTFATDAAGAQSPVVTVTFSVAPQQVHSVDVTYTGSANRLDFGSFSPGASNVASQNEVGVANHLGRDAHFYFDMTDFACTRGGVPVMGNADVALGSVDGNGVFTPVVTKPYSQTTVDFGTLSDGTQLYVKLNLHDVPKGIAGSCTASFGIYHV